MSGPTALVLRHGEASANAMGIFRSWLDVPLTDRGIEQAKAAARFLKRYPIKRIISSPLLRAFVTADIVAAGLPVWQHRGLFPWRLGVFSGLPKDANQDALHLFVENPSVMLPGGESLEAFEDRQHAFWEAALKSSREIGLTLFVCHNSVVTALVNLTRGARDIEPVSGENIKPGGVAEVWYNGKNHEVRPVFGTAEVAQFGGS